MLKKKMLLKTDEDDKQEACWLPSRPICTVSFYHLVFAARWGRFCGTVVCKREDKNCSLKNDKFAVSALAVSWTQALAGMPSCSTAGSVPPLPLFFFFVGLRPLTLLALVAIFIAAT